MNTYIKTKNKELIKGLIELGYEFEDWCCKNNQEITFVNFYAWLTILSLN